MIIIYPFTNAYIQPTFSVKEVASYLFFTFFRRDKSGSVGIFGYRGCQGSGWRMALLTEFSFFSMKKGERGARKTSASKDPIWVEILEIFQMIRLGCQTKQGYIGIVSCISGYFFSLFIVFEDTAYVCLFVYFFIYYVILPEL